LTAAVKCREDHGYTLDLGIRGVSGFLPIKDIGGETELQVGSLIDMTVVKTTANGRICTVSADSAKFANSYVSSIDELRIQC
jgi:rRNA biogenesis protein RRP5